VGASLGNPFVIAEVEPSALTRATPDFPSFRQTVEHTPALNGRLGLYLYAHAGQGNVQARMFAPLGGTIEDPATGSAAGPLGALLLSLTDAPELRLDIHQGVAMGRPSLLRVVARRGADGIRATIAGQCVPVLRGEAEL
jgi:trans-2,3-dihydro-3-hydroxyanthranilate isomerase